MTKRIMNRFVALFVMLAMIVPVLPAGEVEGASGFVPSYPYAAPTIWLDGDILHISASHAPTYAGIWIYLNGVQSHGFFVFESNSPVDLAWLFPAADNSSNTVQVRLSRSSDMNEYLSPLSNSVQWTPSYMPPTPIISLSGNILTWTNPAPGYALILSFNGIRSGSFLSTGGTSTDLFFWSHSLGTHTIQGWLYSNDGWNVVPTGMVSNAVTWTNTTPPLLAPTGLTINGNTLNWNPVAGATGYRVAIWNDSSSFGRQVDNTSFDLMLISNETTLNPGGIWNIGVEAFDGFRNTFSQTITWTVQSNNLNLGQTTWSPLATASSANIGITSNVQWIASSNATSWLTVTPASGSNNGNITLNATANTGATARTGTITVTGGGQTRTITVTQPAAAVNLTLSHSVWSAPATAASFGLGITSNVQWSVHSSVPAWLTVSHSSGVNNATINLHAAANTSGASRTGVITVTGGGQNRTITVTQPAASPNLSVSQTTWSPPAAAASTNIGITSNLQWTVSSSAPSWLIISAQSGSNNGNITLNATANTGTTARTGTITITGGGLTRTVTVTQPAAAANLSIGQTTWSAPTTASNTNVAITSNIQWTASSNATSWLTITPASGSNNGNITLNATANTGTTTRTGIVTITGGGQTREITVTQQAPASTQHSITAAPSNTNAGSVTGTGTFNANQSISLRAIPNIGYHFTGWLENGEIISYSPTLNFTAIGNRTLQAQFEALPEMPYSANVLVGGVRVNFPDQEPAIVDIRTLVPVRGVFEMLGFEVDWEEDTQTAVLTRENHTVRITIGQSTFYTNGIAHELDVPAQIIGIRTMIPLRAPLESVGYEIGWDEDTRTVFVIID